MTTYADPIRKSGPLDKFEHGYNRVAISTDGRFVATSDVDMNVVVRDEGQAVFECNLGSENDKIRPTERVRGLAFSPDGNLLYAAAGSKVFAIQTSNWETVWEYEPPRSFGFLIISPIALDVSPTGDIAAAFDNGTFVVWDGSGVKKETVRDNDSPRWMRFVANGTHLVGSDGFCVCKWPLPQQKRKLKIAPHSRFFGMDADQTGQFAATRTLQHVVIWDLKEKERAASIPVGPGIPLVAFHPTEELVAYAERSRIALVDFKGKHYRDFDLEVSSALSIVFTRKGDEMLIGCTEKTLVHQRI
jgi:WD40 repeat protein